MPRRICSASRNPFVVSRPVRAVRPVSTALVVTVVPCVMRPTRARNDGRSSPAAAAISARPSNTASVGSSGVERTLKTLRSPVPSPSTKSVKVPPTSTPMRNRVSGSLVFSLFFIGLHRPSTPDFSACNCNDARISQASGLQDLSRQPSRASRKAARTGQTPPSRRCAFRHPCDILAAAPSAPPAIAGWAGQSNNQSGDRHLRASPLLSVSVPLPRDFPARPKPVPPPLPVQVAQGGHRGGVAASQRDTDVERHAEAERVAASDGLAPVAGAARRQRVAAERCRAACRSAHHANSRNKAVTVYAVNGTVLSQRGRVRQIR